MPITQTTSAKKSKPIILMTMGQQDKNQHPYQVMTHKYMQPIVEIANAVPLLMPTCFGVEDVDRYLDMVDGVYLSGAGSNIEPSLYGQENLTPEKSQDLNRDIVDLAVIEGALKRKLPILGICRGMQELNIALGGTLYQKVYSEPGFDDHREDPQTPNHVQYGPRHAIKTVPGSWLAKLIGDKTMVNSLHGQGICTLGKGLEALAYGEDGLIEAIHGPDYGQFILGVQWHPEWQANENPDSVKLFQAFGSACRGEASWQSANDDKLTA
ncbi:MULTISPECIES: gamma-glutamyl-gamma-aminobutyrate hydrolase family protein [Shewanella]|uniref:Gamma-glutamyl-gamma-aminobutyrate hydrolase family protein n=1 Tax=Shewanella marisflavi TaxID=260364 RepID=A0ABX5WJU0_9GAMM|nr:MULTISPECIES: gamma-glutamyl-gamma-aminobutyrate hydrolase family protein [Shewanella]QDF74813.1 gamma-glutamyl-gamma-aminobutyrate hydrolase family protein [Shewanella marisflavi]